MSSYSAPVTTISIEFEFPPPRWKAPGTEALTWASVWPRNLPFNSCAISSAARSRSDQSLRIRLPLPELKLPPPKPGAEIRKLLASPLALYSARIGSIPIMILRV